MERFRKCLYHHTIEIYIKCIGLLQPRFYIFGDNLLGCFSLSIFPFLLLWTRLDGFHNPFVLPQNCQKKALSFRAMRQETINRKIFTYKVANYTPFCLNWNFQNICTKFLGNPSHIIFVFLSIESTSTIY